MLRDAMTHPYHRDPNAPRGGGRSKLDLLGLGDARDNVKRSRAAALRREREAAAAQCAWLERLARRLAAATGLDIATARKRVATYAVTARSTVLVSGMNMARYG
jgi:hypothetical protein